MNKSDIDKLRNLPIESVATRVGLTVSRHKSLCPFHEDQHPSLSFNTSRNTFKCFVCDAHGGVIDLAMHVLNKGFKDTCEWLANEHYIILSYENSKVQKVQKVQNHFDASKYSRFFEHPYINDVARDFLYKQRHLDPRVIRWCRLNSFRDRTGNNWLQTPYFDMDGKLLGVQSRNLDYTPHKQGESEGVSRFRFPYGSQCHIYNLNILKLMKPNEPLYIAEGCSDCWSLLSAGHKAIAIPSATLLRPTDFAPVSELALKLGLRLMMYPDNDAPGEKLFLQLKELMLGLGLTLTRHSLPEGCKDFSDFYVQSTGH